MNTSEKLNEEMVKAAKAKDKGRLSALRLMKTALHNKEIDLKRTLTDIEFLQLLSSMVKQRNDSIEQFAKGGRNDLVEKEEAELKVIQEFMPQQLSEEEIVTQIKTAIGEANATGLRDLGKVMKILMPRLTGRADGKAVSDKVKAFLAS
ncbi:MAG: GatB/YqeY domain-containing protein [Deltaproteobacteria bacterium]|nr:GatB/YqeY domain-containing protein [Deltaproteobacteria bacterium]